MRQVPRVMSLEHLAFPILFIFGWEAFRVTCIQGRQEPSVDLNFKTIDACTSLVTYFNKHSLVLAVSQAWLEAMGTQWKHFR